MRALCLTPRFKITKIVATQPTLARSMSAAATPQTGRPRVLVTRQLPPLTQQRLSALSATGSLTVDQWHSVEQVMPRSQLLQRVQGVHGLLVLLTDKVDAELLDAAGSQLKVVSTMSVGCDHVDLQACKDRGIRVCSTPGVLTDATAEIAVGLVISTMRRFGEAQRAVRDGTWGSWNPLWLCGSQLTGKTLGIFGLGRIGVGIAERLLPFKVGRVLYTGPREKPDEAQKVNAEYVDFATLLAQSDIVVISSVLNDSTRKVFNAAAFAQMKPTSVLINIARGGIVNQADLASALEAGPIALDDPLLAPGIAGRVVVLPHIGSATKETRVAMASMAVDHVIDHVLSPSE
ncbi:glyoxylate reductase [Entophlyctis helioformis]|nr:glyoxylate reductase [Entophlyctis helioformis]